MPYYISYAKFLVLKDIDKSVDKKYGSYLFNTAWELVGHGYLKYKEGSLTLGNRSADFVLTAKGKKYLNKYPKFTPYTY